MGHAEHGHHIRARFEGDSRFIGARIHDFEVGKHQEVRIRLFDPGDNADPFPKDKRRACFHDIDQVVEIVQQVTGSGEVDRIQREL